MTNIIVCAGHDNTDPGAIAYDGKTTEASLTKELRDLVIKELHGTGHPKYAVDGSVMQDIDADKLWQTINQINAIATDCRGIDIHFDYNAPNASGVSVFINEHTNPANRKRATYLAQEVANVIGIPTRSSGRKGMEVGVKYPSDSQHTTLGILDRTRWPMMLIEVCFLNKNDLPKYLANKEKVALVIANALANDFAS